MPFTEKDRCYVLDYVRCPGYPEGVEYLGEDIHVLERGDEFDVILICHVLEHAIKPCEVLSGLSPFLSDEGLVCIEVPLGAFLEWRCLKEPITHVNFFSEESISNCAREAGLDVVYLSADYQWVTHQKMWCVNVLARKSTDTPGRLIPPADCRKTRRQMRSLRLLAPVAYNRLLRALRFHER